MGDNGAVTRIQLGTRLTRGLGAGGDPELGRAAAEEAIERVREVCQGAEMVFVLTGMGGGTGTGGAPVVARVARETGALVMGLATLPFACEGSRRQRQARRGIEEFKAASDAVLALPNQRVLSLIDENTSLLDTFGFIEALLAEGVRGLWRLVGRPGLINVDFADLREMMRDRHAESFFAYAETEGEARSRDIVERLTLNPLLENGSLLRTTGAALVSVVAGPSLTMAEVNRVTDLLRRECEGADLLLGATVDPALGERLSLTFIGVQRNPNRADEDFSAAEAGAPAEGASTSVEAESLETDFFNRKPPARRARSRFIAPPPELSPEEYQKAVRGRRGRGRPRMQQAMLPLEVVSKGRFEKSEPTVHHGEDLDIPTFVRRGVVFN
jgi:cell division protein FtsZ